MSKSEILRELDEAMEVIYRIEPYVENYYDDDNTLLLDLYWELLNKIYFLRKNLNEIK